MRVHYKMKGMAYENYQSLETYIQYFYISKNKTTEYVCMSFLAHTFK